jgi:Fe-S-cluster containining protein
MGLDFSKQFEKYEALVRDVNTIFARVSEQYPEQVVCTQGCADCCHAMFDLSLVEAAYLSQKFREVFPDGDPAREVVLARADEHERKHVKIVRNAHKKKVKGGATDEDVLAEVASHKLRCPLLGDDDLCVLYEHRPITCRLYGIPTDVGGEARTCGRSGFEAGVEYPSVKMEKIFERLQALSLEMAQEAGAGQIRIAEVLVPASMALINVYDEGYLGVSGDDPRDGSCTEEKCGSCDSKESCPGVHVVEIGGPE